MQVIKRGGKVYQEFDKTRIENAIISAFESCNIELSPEKLELIMSNILMEIEKFNIISVEHIQDIVERNISLFNFEVAKKFIIYRYEHKEDRILRDRIDYMSTYINSDNNAATSSEEDSNSNVTVKNVANLNGETFKNLNRRLQRLWIKDKLNELFPEVSKQYTKDLEHHIIYAHDEASFPVPTNYCEAVSLYPLIMNGTSTMDGLKTKPPTNLNSFCGQLINLTFLLAAQCKGAVAYGEFFNFFDYFCVKEWGPEWDKHIKDIVTSDICNKEKTIEYCIKQAFQNIVYSWNQPAGNRSYQSPFINISYYDSNYWKSLFEDFSFPDGSKPEWRRIDILQKMFMQWFNEERQKTLLTFPVETMALLTDGNDVIDKDYKNFTAEMWSKGHSFFLYISDNPDGLSSCCFSKDTKVLWKSSYDGVKYTTLEELHNIKWDPYKKNLRIFHNGSWVKGKSIKLPNRQMYKIVTFNNKEFIVSDNHINITLDGEKKTESLTVNDYLMFNTLSLNATPENDEHLTYAQGLLIGLFLGDGSFGNYVCLDNSVHNFYLSLNENKWNKVKDILSTLGDFKLGTIYNNVYPISCCDKDLTTFISKWTTNEPNNTYAYNKKLNLNCLLQSKEFRQGILDGWYITDGGNSNRCYTISKDLVDSMEILCTSLGLQTIINISDRTDEDVIIRGEKFSRNYPLYCLRWYIEANHRSNKEINKSWIKKNNSIYWKIKSIEPIEYKDDIYCIECNNQDEPYFTLPCGLITHNCRLRNSIDSNVFSFTNGLSGVKTGSCNVITLNLNRIIQDWCKSIGGVPTVGNQYDSLKLYLINILERVYKYHIAYKTLLYEEEKRGMLTASNAGYISMKDLFSTIGLNGLNEAAECLGIKCNYNSEYKDFCNLILGTISEQNKLHSTKEFKFNTEIVPAEQLGSRNYNWDKADGYKVPENRVLYNSYFYLPEDNTISILDKFKLHGREFTSNCDGGMGLHCNLDSHLSKNQYLKLIDYAIKCGTFYFTFNIPNTQCDDCGHIEKIPIKECPICHSKNVTHWTRPVGYLRPTKCFDEYRYKESLMRFYANGKFEIEDD